MPVDAVYVGRPSQWGNPFKAEQFTRSVMEASDPRARRRAVEAYRREIMNHGGYVRKHLRGKDLACWCPLDQPCHADVLLEIANA